MRLLQHNVCELNFNVCELNLVESFLAHPCPPKVLTTSATFDSKTSTPLKPNLTAIVAVTPSGVIGDDDAMPWKLSSDLQRFKRLTMNGSLIMGRKTFQSIGRPLPGRATIVLTRNRNWAADGVVVAHEIQDLAAVLKQQNARFPAGDFVVGGGEIYRLLSPHIERWLITRVWSGTRGDTTLDIDWDEFKQVSQTSYPAGHRDSVPTMVEIWRRTNWQTRA